MNTIIKRRWMVLVGVATLCSIITTVIVTHTPEVEPKARNTGAGGMPVTVTSVLPGNYQATVTALGEVVPL